MPQSKVVDEDGQPWPDPLVDYNNGLLSSIPTEYTITSRDLERFWVCMYEQYGINELEDMWLNVNGIRYLMDLKPGDKIYKVEISDLTGYILNKQVGTDDS